MTKLKLEVISFIQTFLTLFLIDLAVAIKQYGPEAFLNPANWTVATVIGVVSAVGRSAFKAAWQKWMPSSIGGVKR